MVTRTVNDDMMAAQRWARCAMLTVAMCVSLMADGWLLTARYAWADIPHVIRYQGTVVDAKQVPLEGPYTLTFRLYDAVDGGAEVWEETQTNVPVVDGQFSVLLGQVTPLDLPFDKDLWLSIEVGSDGEMSPRQRLSSVPYAYRAEVAENTKTSAIEDDAYRFVPSGIIVMATGPSCPAGYTRFAAMDGKFLVPGTTYNATAGGSNTHDHGGATSSHALTVAEMPAHSHGGIQTSVNGGGNQYGNGEWNFGNNAAGSTSATGGDQGHMHPIASADSRPEFATVLLCQKQ